MSLRRVKSNDLEKIIILDHEVLKTNWHERLYLEEIVNSDSEFWLLELENDVIGFILIRRNMVDAEVLQFAVSKRFQKQGFGSILMDKAIEITNRELLFLEVSQKNESAINFYLKNNFETIFIRKNYYGPSEDALVMRKRLK